MTDDLQRKFEANVERGDADECWPWSGSTQSSGYPQLRHDGTMRLAHRVALELDGRPPGDDYALHTCDNPVCVNPAHLYVGDAADNLADARERGRWDSGETPSGEDNPNAKLTDEQVAEMRRDYEDASQRELAEKYGVSRGHVHRIVSGERRTDAATEAAGEK